MALDFAAQLDDRMSGPAKNIAEKMGKMDSATERAAAQLDRIEKKLDSLGGKAPASAKKIGLWVEVWHKVGEAARSAGEKVVEMGRKAIDAAGFRRESLIALESITGTRDRALQIFEAAHTFTQRSGLPTEQFKAVEQEYQRLALAGLDARDSSNILAAGLDLSAKAGRYGAAGMGEFAEGIRTIYERNQFTAKSVKAFAATGLQESRVWELLGTRYKVTAEAARKMANEGKISAREGIGAIVEASAPANEALGTLSRTLGMSLGGGINKVELAAEGLFARLLEGGKNSKFATMLDEWAQKLDSIDVDQVREGLDRFVGTVRESLPTAERFVQILGNIGGAFHDIGSAIGTVTGPLGSFGDWLGRSFREMMTPSAAAQAENARNQAIGSRYGLHNEQEAQKWLAGGGENAALAMSMPEGDAPSLVPHQASHQARGSVGGRGGNQVNIEVHVELVVQGGGSMSASEAVSVAKEKLRQGDTWTGLVSALERAGLSGG